MFGPPLRVTVTSACPYLDHRVSGLLLHTTRPIQTRFRCAYTLRLKLACKSNSLTHYTKGTLSHSKVLQLIVGIRFQVYFTPLIGVLFTFPSRYLFTIGRSGVLSLRGWSPYFQTEFHVFRLTQGLCRFLRIQDYHLLWCDFPDTSASYNTATGLVPVRSPLLGESQLISFPPVTKMFQFTGFASYTYVFSIRYSKRVGFPIRRSAGKRVFAPNRSLSQRTTSFIASDRQGIHQMPLKTLEFKSRAGINPHAHNLTQLFKDFVRLDNMNLEYVHTIKKTKVITKSLYHFTTTKTSNAAPVMP